jgi:hypothetical protein
MENLILDLRLLTTNAAKVLTKSSSGKVIVARSTADTGNFI